MTISSAWPVFVLAAVLRCQDAGPLPYKPPTDKDRQTADALFAAGRYTDALPIYTDLAKRDPTVPLFAERRAAGLIAKSATLEKTSQKLALQRQAFAELLRARAMGDNSPYVTSLLAKLSQLFDGPAISSVRSASQVPKADTADLLKQGQIALAHGDYTAALRSYTAASQADPRSYEAALSAGEAAARLHNIDDSGTWYSRAIEINPNRETAYLAWGNVLLGDKRFAPARDHLIDAVIAWPYSRECWDALRQWAELTHGRLVSPHLERPPVSDNFDPKSISEDGTGRGAWLQYIVGRISYKNSLFRAKFPAEPSYRHTLLEEVSCLQRAAEAARAENIPPAKLDPSINTLMDLSLRHMLEPWVLLHGADAGIVQDYPAYRDSHRELLRAYLLQYDIHSPP